MAVVALIALAAGLVWGVLYARRGSLVLATAALVIVGYVFGYEFWNARVGPLPLTLDRILLVAVVGVFVAQWRWGQLEHQPLAGADWLLVVLLVLLATSALMAGSPQMVVPDRAPPMWRLVMCFVAPAVMYFVVRDARLTHRAWCAVLTAMWLLGVYLALTAVAEVAGNWSLVFPRYIADPTLGIHFGRARGPELNSASLGIYLTACLWCGWMLRTQVSRIWQLVLLASLPLMVAGVFFTYTRSTWIGLVASAAMVGWWQLPRHGRLPAFSVAALAAVLAAAVMWNDVLGLEREGTAGESHHSVDQRKSFAYVSWQMFKDHPLMGVGFGRFYDRKLPYLSDRSQEFELESLRALDHHNTFLSLLVETGLPGLAAFVGLLAAWARAAWLLAKNVGAPSWVRAQGVLALAVLASYFASALFHDLSLLPSQQWLLFVFAGVTMNLRLRESCVAEAASSFHDASAMRLRLQTE